MIDAGVGGTWLLGPNDITIDQTAASTIASTLNAGTSVTQQTSAAGTGGVGDITVGPNVAIDWGTGARLTLSAYRNIPLGGGATLTSMGGGAVTLYADDTGTGTGSVTFGTGAKVSTSGAVNIFYDPVAGAGTTVEYFSPTDYAGNVAGGAKLTPYMLVNTAPDLRNVGYNNAAAYALGRDIDLARVIFHPITSPYGDNIDNNGQGSGFFTGLFEGQGHSILNMAITSSANPPSRVSSSHNSGGLFSALGTGGAVRDVNLVGGSIVAGIVVLGIDGAPAFSAVGSIVGANCGGMISNVTSSVAVSAVGITYVGGLVGLNGGGTITSSTASGAVSAKSFAYSNYSYDSVAAVQGAGGLVGTNRGSIVSSYATGAVAGADSLRTGGFVGGNSGSIDGAYASGAVSGTGGFAGFVAANAAGGTITNGYWDEGTTGQLLGFATNSGSITRLVSIGGDTGYREVARFV